MAHSMSVRKSLIKRRWRKTPLLWVQQSDQVARDIYAFTPFMPSAV
jgi:hypothetical protein